MNNNNHMLTRPSYPPVPRRQCQCPRRLLLAAVLVVMKAATAAGGGAAGAGAPVDAAAMMIVDSRSSCSSRRRRQCRRQQQQGTWAKVAPARVIASSSAATFIHHHAKAAVAVNHDEEEQGAVVMSRAEDNGRREGISMMMSCVVGVDDDASLASPSSLRAAATVVSDALHEAWTRQEPLLIRRGALASLSSSPPPPPPLPTVGQLLEWVVGGDGDDDDGVIELRNAADTTSLCSKTTFPGESARLVVRNDPPQDLESMTLQWGPFEPHDLQWMNDDDDGSMTPTTEGTKSVAHDPTLTSGVRRRSTFAAAAAAGRRRENRRRTLTRRARPTQSLSCAPVHQSVAYTLLLNDVDRYLPELANWLDHEFTKNLLGGDGHGSGGSSSSQCLFPRWRRDDAQLSVSSTGGGVGPHVDSYDVFLLQVSGRKQWTVSQAPMSVVEEHDRTIPDLDVRVLDLDQRRTGPQAGMDSPVAMHQPIVVESGDILYIPPRYVHDGVALINHCQTLSVGCRAPSSSELLSRITDTFLTSRIGAPGRSMLSSAVLEAGAERYTEGVAENSSDKVNHDARPTLSQQAKDKMKGMVRNAVEAVLADELLWDELAGRLVTESLRGSDDLASLLAWDEDEDNQEADMTNSDGGTGIVWQRRPGVSMATSQPTASRTRMFCHGEMWEADVADPHDRERLLSLLLRVEQGERIEACDIRQLTSPASTELWSCLVRDGVVVNVDG